MGPFLWLLQWPIRALVLLFVGILPLGVEFSSFGTALLSAAVIGLLGTLLIWPLRLVLALPWALTSLGGMVTPITAVYNWVITIVLFALAAWLIQGFRLKNGLISAALGAIVYSVLSTLILGWLGLDVSFTRVSSALSAAVGVG